MDLGMTAKVKPLVEKVRAMVREEIVPLEAEYEAEIGKNGNRWSYTKRQEEIREGLKAKARERGLWNFWLTKSKEGHGLTTVEYAYLAEEMGWSRLAPETFNCSAPDTGNMEVLHRYGTHQQQEEWLRPLLAGEIRSAFSMTEPDVASSDATNVQTRIERDGNSYVINGRKWWTSGLGDPCCKILVVMGKTNPEAPRHKQQSQVLVPVDTPGIRLGRMVTNFGYDDAPHGHYEVTFDNVRVPAIRAARSTSSWCAPIQQPRGTGATHRSWSQRAPRASTSCAA